VNVPQVRRAKRTVRGAAVDVILIVLGVLIALGVDAWMGRLQEMSQERHYLTVIRSDLEEDLKFLEGRFFPEIEARLAAVDTIRAILGQPPSEPTEIDELLRAMSQAGFYAIFSPRKAAFNDLINTGNLRILRDQQLRLDLLRYYASVEFTHPYDEWARHLIWSEFRTEAGRYPVPPEISLPELASNPTFRRGLQNAQQFARWQRHRFGPIAAELRTLIERLDMALGEPREALPR
jgi:hypothetical protein